MKKDPKLHLGHFERVRNDILKTSVYDLKDIQVLEMLLQGVFHRADTNEVARSILSVFQTFDNLYTNATLENLSSIRGLGEKTAKKLLAFLKLFVYAKRAPNTYVTTALNNFENILDHARNQFTCMNERVVMFILDKNYNICATELICEGDLEHAVVNTRQVIESILRHGCSAIVIAHNHIDASFFPSREDEQFTYSLCRLLHNKKIELVDHIIVSPTGYFSFHNSNLLRAIKLRLNNNAIGKELSWFDQ